MDQVDMSLIITDISITTIAMNLLFTNHNDYVDHDNDYDDYVDHDCCNDNVDYEDYNDNDDYDDYDYDYILHSSSSWPVSTSLSPLTSSRFVVVNHSIIH